MEAHRDNASLSYKCWSMAISIINRYYCIIAESVETITSVVFPRDLVKNGKIIRNKTAE